LPSFRVENQEKRLAAGFWHLNGQNGLAVELGRPKFPFASAKRAWLFKDKGGHCLSQTGLASLAAALKRHV
jgi:hypothetical protein